MKFQFLFYQTIRKIMRLLDIHIYKFYTINQIKNLKNLKLPSSLHKKLVFKIERYQRKRTKT
jgi:hypothetical protein